MQSIGRCQKVLASGDVLGTQFTPLIRQPLRQIRPVKQADIARAAATSKSGVEALKSLKPDFKGASVDPLYMAASDYLGEIGFTNLAEKSRVLDIAMNPNSLFLGRSKNASARPLDPETDMKPVVNFFISKKVSVGNIVKIITGHPPVLSYSTVHLDGFWQYLESIGIADVGEVVATRPNLLGLDVDNNLRKIVEYLQYVETPTETIINTAKLTFGLEKDGPHLSDVSQVIQELD